MLHRGKEVGGWGWVVGEEGEGRGEKGEVECVFVIFI